MRFAFFKGKGTLLDRVIKFWTRGKYSHCECILQGPTDSGSYLCASAVPGIGVRIAWIKLPQADWDIVVGPGDLKKVREWFIKRQGMPYDYTGLFHFVYSPASGDVRGKYFCSQACLEAIGFKETWRYYPDLMYSAVTYKGDYQ